MPTMPCPGCGSTVRFEGVAGVCPKCASVVRAPRTAEAAPSGSTRRSAAKPARRSGTKLEDLEAVTEGEPETFAPAATDAGRGGGPLAFLSTMDPRVSWGIGAGLVLVAGFGLYSVLHTPSSTLAPVKPQPAFVPPPIASVPVGPTGPGVAPPRVGVPTTAPTQSAVVALPAWYGLQPVKPKLEPEKINDELVERALMRGVAFMKPRLAAGVSANGMASPGGGYEAGVECLATYAMLHAGQAVADTELAPTSTLMSEALSRLQSVSVAENASTYTFSLRAQAMGLAGRESDRSQLEKDRAWLLRAAVGGAYAYGAVRGGPNTPPPTEISWDNSNTQYGVLGIWAASEAGLPAPARYWQDSERHWVGTQLEAGGWGYNAGNGPSTSMTAAGVTSLSVAAEQEVLITTGEQRDRAKGRAAAEAAEEPRAHPAGKGAVHPPAAPPPTPAEIASAIERGVNYLGTGTHILEPGSNEGYTLYGIERAALATGYRFFGEHDWYRELGAKQLGVQEAAGSWGGQYGPDVETSFRLLFLARGRQPLLMNKLKFAGAWNNRPRDVAKLVAYTSSQLERPFAWGVADLERDWWTWLDAPMVFVSTDTPPELDERAIAKLRDYVDAGGFLLVHNEFASPEVDAFAQDLARRMFAGQKLTPVPADDLIYRTLFPMTGTTRPPLQAVTNGVRPLMVYSPTDLSKAWLAWRPKAGAAAAAAASANPDLQMGINLFVAAAGKRDYRNRLNSPYLNPSTVAPIGRVPVQRLTYPGGHADPEPGAWLRFARWFIDETSISLDVTTVDVTAVSLANGPVAVLTGTGKVDWGAVDTAALGKFVRDGGTLLVDAAGGDKAFAESVREGLLPAAFGGVQPAGLPAAHPVAAGTGACMTPLPAKPKLRAFAAERMGMSATPPSVQVMAVGAGSVIVSDLDVTNALLHGSTYGVNGYASEYADALYKNAILWTLSRFQSAASSPPPPVVVPAAK